MKLRALTIHQPYASLIAEGRKRIETRSWPTKYRGPIAIHAAKWPRVNGHPTRAIVAIAELVDVVRVETLTDLEPGERALGNYGAGRWGWRLADARPLPAPVPCRGFQGLWIVDPAIAARVLRSVHSR